MNSEDQKKSSSGTETTEQEGIVDQAKHVMSVVADKVGDEVNHQIDARRDTAVKKIGGVAQAIRWSSGLLKDVGPLGDVTTKAADGVEGVASFFENKQIGDVVREVERFARREPAIFLGAALAVGLIGGRFLKSSTHGSDVAEDDGYDDHDDVPMGTYRAHRDVANGYGYGYGEDGYLRSSDLMDYESRRDGMAQNPTASKRTGPTTSRSGSATARPATRSATGAVPPRPPQPAATAPIKPTPIVNAATGSESSRNTAPMQPVERPPTPATATTPSTTAPPSNGIAGR